MGHLTMRQPVKTDIDSVECRYERESTHQGSTGSAKSCLCCRGTARESSSALIDNGTRTAAATESLQRQLV